MVGGTWGFMPLVRVRVVAAGKSAADFGLSIMIEQLMEQARYLT